MRIKLKGLHTVTKKLADGTRRTYFYAWKGGPPLRGEPGTPEFIQSFTEATGLDKATPMPLLPTRRHKGVRKYIYIIGHAKDGPVKIGVSARPKNRLCALQSASHIKLKILAKFPGDEKHEVAAHWALRFYCIRGEWFDRAAALKWFADNIARGVPIEQYEEPENEVEKWIAKHLEGRAARAPPPALTNEKPAAVASNRGPNPGAASHTDHHTSEKKSPAEGHAAGLNHHQESPAVPMRGEPYGRPYKIC